MSDERPLISIVTPTYNEQDNIEELHRRVKAAISGIDAYRFEMIIIDNASTDSTRDKLRALAAANPDVRVIFNTRNFGHIRSPYYGILQAYGDAVVYLASDLQDPPEMIPQFFEHWEKGYRLVMAVKPTTQGSRFVHALRKAYYRGLDSISEVPILHDSTGFGLYDRRIVDHLRQIEDPYPFLRGLVAELGYPVKTIPFEQPRRLRGISKNNIYTLYDIAWLGIVSHSKLPMRVAAFAGFLIGFFSILGALIFLVLKLLFWAYIPIGIAPITIGVFFLIGMQFIFIGILGEYIGSILTYVQKRPVVVELERINFDDET